MSNLKRYALSKNVKIDVDEEEKQDILKEVNNGGDANELGFVHFWFNEMIYSLNLLGSLVFSRLTKPATLCEITQYLLDEIDLEEDCPGDAELFVEEFLADMVSRDIVEIVEHKV